MNIHLTLELCSAEKNYYFTYLYYYTYIIISCVFVKTYKAWSIYLKENCIKFSENIFWIKLVFLISLLNYFTSFKHVLSRGVTPKKTRKLIMKNLKENFHKRKLWKKCTWWKISYDFQRICLELSVFFSYYGEIIFPCFKHWDLFSLKRGRKTIQITLWLNSRHILLMQILILYTILLYLIELKIHIFCFFFLKCEIKIVFVQ